MGCLRGSLAGVLLAAGRVHGVAPAGALRSAHAAKLCVHMLRSPDKPAPALLPQPPRGSLTRLVVIVHTVTAEAPSVPVFEFMLQVGRCRQAGRGGETGCQLAGKCWPAARWFWLQLLSKGWFACWLRRKLWGSSLPLGEG